MNAYKDLMKYLNEGETVEAIVFGEWGYGWYGFGDNDEPIPADKQGVVLSEEEAKPLMDGWSFFGGFGSPTSHAVNIWTNKRVIWVTQYDGSTTLDSAPRHPTAYMPDMPGG